MHSEHLPQVVSFTRMDEGTEEDYALLDRFEKQHIRSLPDRLLSALQMLEQSLDGYQLSRLQHSLQSASRAEDDGADIELIVAALIHDLGDDLAPENHSQLAAAIIRPYVRPEVAWVVHMHGLFFKCNSMAHKWACRSTATSLTRITPGMRPVSVFVMSGIRRRLIRTTPRDHCPILNR